MGNNTWAFSAEEGTICMIQFCQEDKVKTSNQIIKYSCASNVGRIRNQNQDNFICDGVYMNHDACTEKFSLAGTANLDGIHLYGVFDGLGGEECGEVASYIAAREAALLKPDDMQYTGLKQYCYRANQMICQYAEEHGIYSMGTTVALLSLSENEICICNIGDSKVFRFDGVHLKQLSVDHLAHMPAGMKRPLSQNLGISEDLMVIEPYLKQQDYCRKDIFIICSDGLTDMVSMEEMWKLLKESDVEDLANILTDHALKNGGKDNVTVIALQAG